jgi:predicted amidophosphoribosyltransferase
MKCSECGHENRNVARFCEECAAPLGRKCRSCGADLRAKAKFCDECAAPLAAVLACPTSLWLEESIEARAAGPGGPSR